MEKKIFIGVDIGGTKIAAGVVDNFGRILSRGKLPVPGNSSPRKIFAIISKLIKKIAPSSPKISGIGVAVPGIVDTKKNEILAAPNINLAGFNLSEKLEKRFNTYVTLGNDVNLGTLAEQRFGKAAGLKNVIGIFPGTGVGGGIIINGELFTGNMGAAGEVGHIIIDKEGPKCTCGNRGCLEALAGRWAIERDIKKAVKNGEKSSILKLNGGNLKIIKSKVLNRALKQNDKLVSGIIKNASYSLGLACVTLRHIFDPEMIIFGGGLIEACADYMMPPIKETVSRDPFFKKIQECKIIPSSLGDDAVILGAAALAGGITCRETGKTQKAFVKIKKPGSVEVNGIIHKNNIYIRCDGKIKELEGKNQEVLTLKRIKKICKKKPEIFISGSKQKIILSPEATKFIKENNTKYVTTTPEKAVNLYNSSARNACLLIV